MTPSSVRALLISCVILVMIIAGISLPPATVASFIATVNQALEE